MRRRIDSRQSPSVVGFRRSTGGSSSNTLPREGRDTLKLPQITVNKVRLRAKVADARRDAPAVEQSRSATLRLGDPTKSHAARRASRRRSRLVHAELSAAFKCEGRRAATEIVEQGVGARRQSQAPGMAEFEVKEQSSSRRTRSLRRGCPSTHINRVDDRTQYSDDSVPPSSERQAFRSCGAPDQPRQELKRLLEEPWLRRRLLIPDVLSFVRHPK